MIGANALINLHSSGDASEQEYSVGLTCLLQNFIKELANYMSNITNNGSMRLPLREKCPNAEFFLVSRFIFSPNTGKYGQEKTPYLDYSLLD